MQKRVMGIEPTYPAWKAGVLPLNYTRIFNCSQVGVTGFEPATSWSQTRRSSQAEPHPEGYLFASVSSVTQVVLYYRVSKMSTLFSNFFNYFFNFYNLITEPPVRQGVLCLSVLSPISFLPYNSFTRSSFIARSALPL